MANEDSQQAGGQQQWQGGNAPGLAGVYGRLRITIAGEASREPGTLNVTTTTKGDDGRYGWIGGYGTSGYIDPQNDLVGILLTQRSMESPQPPQAFVDFWTQAYAAIGD